MNPGKVGDTHDIAKLSMLRWLAPGEKWLIHPMYFPTRSEERDEAFPCRYADSLQVQLVRGDIWQRQQLIDSVAEDQGHLFLDPDTGLRLDYSRTREHVTVRELIEVANSPARKRKLTLVYDHTIDRNPKQIDCDEEEKGPPGQQIIKKLRRLHEAEVHAAAYIAHNQRIAFVWASADPGIVSGATRRIQPASRLPDCCFVDDGCGHIPQL